MRKRPLVSLLGVGFAIASGCSPERGAYNSTQLVQRSNEQRTLDVSIKGYRPGVSLVQVFNGDGDLLYSENTDHGGKFNYPHSVFVKTNVDTYDEFLVVRVTSPKGRNFTKSFRNPTN